MSRDDEKPSTDRAKASIKEAIGKLTGDVKVQAEGEAEKRLPKSVAKSGSTRMP